MAHDEMRAVRRSKRTEDGLPTLIRADLGRVLVDRMQDAVPARLDGVP